MGSDVPARLGEQSAQMQQRELVEYEAYIGGCGRQSVDDSLRLT